MNESMEIKSDKPKPKEMKSASDVSKHWDKTKRERSASDVSNIWDDKNGSDPLLREQQFMERNEFYFIKAFHSTVRCNLP